MIPYGSIWYYMIPYDTIWYHMVPYGTIWYMYHMVPYLGRGGYGYVEVGFGLGWIRHGEVLDL